jgi:hypothetical protein
MNFWLFLQNRQKVAKQHFCSKNDDAELEKEIFLQIGLDLNIKKLILIYNLKILKNNIFLKKNYCIFLYQNAFWPK